MEIIISEIIKNVVPVVITGVVAIFVALIKTVANEVVDYISAKKEAVAIKIGVDKYNANLEIASNIYKLVDEHFRITPQITATIEDKQKLFEYEIKRVIPYITDEEIVTLRQSVAGIVNVGKVAIAPVDTTAK
jgi:predicted transcriptional regulator